MESVDKDLLAVTIIILGAIIGLLFAKGSLIWRDVMLKRNERHAKDMERYNELNAIKKN